MSRRPSLVSLWLPVLAIAGALFVLSHQSQLPVDTPGSDLLAHAVAYTALGLVFVRACHRGLGPLRWWPSVTAVVLTVAWGASDEWHQSFVPGRTASLADLGADATGALLGVGLFALLGAVRGKRSRGQGFSRS